jgi:hypothetical protein
MNKDRIIIRKSSGKHNQKKGKGCRSKHVKQEDMQQQQPHCPPTKQHGDRNLMRCHDEPQKDVV